eukprot:11288420-Alexandrium_andersonii.AAC.1
MLRFRDVYAVGLTGKRSVMLACVIALLIRGVRRNEVFAALREQSCDMEQTLRAVSPCSSKRAGTE